MNTKPILGMLLGDGACLLYTSQRCKERGIPVVAIVGGMGHKAETIFDHGVDSIMTTINGAMELEEALDRSEELYVSAADRMFRMLKAGMSLR